MKLDHFSLYTVYELFMENFQLQIIENSENKVAFRFMFDKTNSLIHR